MLKHADNLQNTFTFHPLFAVHDPSHVVSVSPIQISFYTWFSWIALILQIKIHLWYYYYHFTINCMSGERQKQWNRNQKALQVCINVENLKSKAYILHFLVTFTSDVVPKTFSFSKFSVKLAVIGTFSSAISVFKQQTFYICFQVGSIHNYLRRRLHLQVSPQPRGLLQRGACNCPNGLHHLMGHILNTQVIFSYFVIIKVLNQIILLWFTL